jgi:hypothetical protein
VSKENVSWYTHEIMSLGLNDEELTKLIFEKDVKGSIPKEYEDELLKRHILARTFLKETLFSRNTSENVFKCF